MQPEMAAFYKSSVPTAILLPKYLLFSAYLCIFAEKLIFIVELKNELLWRKKQTLTK